MQTVDLHVAHNPGLYQEVLASQGNGCAICGTKTPRSKSGRFVPDHCHKTGVFRGLLCQKCNLTLGMLGDDFTSVRSNLAAILRYLDPNGKREVDAMLSAHGIPPRSRSVWLFRCRKQVAKHGDAASWHIGWYDSNKRRRCRSIGTKEQAETAAKALAEELRFQVAS